MCLGLSTNGVIEMPLGNKYGTKPTIIIVEEILRRRGHRKWITIDGIVLSTRGKYKKTKSNRKSFKQKFR